MTNQILPPRRTASTLTLRGFACLAAVMLVTACAGDAAEHWTPQEAPKENKVSWITFEHNVGFGSAGGSLSKQERTRINNFLAEVNVGGSDHVFIRTKQSGRNHQLTAITKYLRAKRLRPEIIVARGATAPISIVVGRYLVTAPSCPDWTKRPGQDSGNRRSSNFGCATTTNLGLMVADPGDLVHGVAIGPSDGARGASSVQKYRTGKVKDLPAVTLKAQGGK